MKSATDVFAQKTFPNDIFNSEIYCTYDKLVIGPCVVMCSYFQIGLARRVRPILKLFSRLLP